MEAKDTQTRKIYNQCLEEIRQQGKSKPIEKDEDDKVMPIRNIFKMSRILVTTDKSRKKLKKAMKNAKLGLNQKGSMRALTKSKDNDDME